MHSTRYGRQRNVNISTRLVLGIVESYEVVCARATTRLRVYVLSVALVVAFAEQDGSPVQAARVQDMMDAFCKAKRLTLHLNQLISLVRLLQPSVNVAFL